MSVCLELERIERQQLLTAVFQPLADLRLGNVFGYEGLIRGPQGTPWLIRWRCLKPLSSVAVFSR